MSLPEIESLSRAFVPLLFGTLIRSTALALFCGALNLLLHSGPAEIRHSIWRGMLFGLLLLPGLQIATGIRSLENLGRPVGAWILVVAIIYLAVAFALCVCLAAGLHRLKGIVRRSQFIGDSRLRELAHDAWLASGAFLIPRMRFSSEVIVPVAVESGQEMFILLPGSCQKWDDGKLRLVLAHEMGHVRRGDPATAFLASVATCLFWFHPLSWFLKRHLAALAEEACDDVAAQAASSPEQYAQILIDFAKEVVNRRARVLEPASAMVRGGQLQMRIKRIFAASQLHRKRLGLVRALALTALFPAVYLAGAARFDAQQERPALSLPITPDKAAQLEANLQTNPDDLKTREALLGYYFNERQRVDVIRQLLWLIRNHPESPLAGMAAMFLPEGGPLNTASDYAQVKSAWEGVLASFPRSGDVLFNAGAFLARSDPERSLDLLQEVREMDSSVDPATSLHDRSLQEIANIYNSAIVSVNEIHLNTEFAARLRNQLENSTDAALLSAVGTRLVRFGITIDSPIKDRGFELLQRAIDLDPANPRWQEALESAKAEPVRQQNYRQMTKTPTVPSGAVRIGGAVAEANLLSRVEPEYPPLALAARVQGSVEFNVTIGASGHVQNIQLVRGHPLLVNAALNAVRQWVYRPTLLNGQAVPAVTDVLVPFRLPQ